MSKYDITYNPVYQVNWEHKQSGKRVAATKRRVSFSFGFSNRDAIDQGLTGNDCRGEEHQVDLVWSLTSGKRLVIADGVEVHFSTGKFTDSVFETSWNVAGGHTVKLVAYAAPPLFATPGFRQFDLMIDGLSFFDMPKIYELGTASATDRALAAANAATYMDDAHIELDSTPEFASPTTTRRRKTPVERRSSMPELPHEHVAPVRYPMPERRNTMPELPPAVAPTPPPATPVVQAPPPPQLEWTQAAPVHDEFAPVAPQPPTPEQEFAQRSNEILAAYTPSPSVPALTYTPHYANYDAASPGAVSTDVSEYSEDSSFFQTPQKEASAPNPPVLKPTMEPISIAEMVPEEPEPAEPLDRAMKSLVNLDDINFSMETPEQAKMARELEERKANDTTKSRPLKPMESWTPRASLKDIKLNSTPKESTNKEVMRTHAFHPAAASQGMMVVYGAPGAPPQQGGFGVGAYHHHHTPAAPPVYRAY